MTCSKLSVEQSDFIFLIFVLIALSNPIDLEKSLSTANFLETECGLHTQLTQLVEQETNHLRAADPIIFVVNRGII